MHLNEFNSVKNFQIAVQVNEVNFLNISIEIYQPT